MGAPVFWVVWWWYLHVRSGPVRTFSTLAFPKIMFSAFVSPLTKAVSALIKGCEPLNKGRERLNTLIKAGV
jgi:hypothetical protein